MLIGSMEHNCLNTQMKTMHYNVINYKKNILMENKFSLQHDLDNPKLYMKK